VGNTLIALGLPGPLSSAVDAWSEYAEGHVSHVAKAAGFVRFALSRDAESGRRIAEPRHYVIAFPLRDQGRQKHQSALFTLRVVREEEIPRDPNAQGAVANHLRFKPPAERRLIPGADEYVEFELLSREHEVPSQQPLRISMGPVRADKLTGQKEFVRVDMGQCIQRIATDIIQDPRGGQRLVQSRWWMCIETLRLLCNCDHIDCTALDKAGVPPQEWVIRLIDTHSPINRKEELQGCQEERNIDDLMDFIDNHGPGRGLNGGHGGAAGAQQGLAPNGNSQRPTRVRKKKGTKDKERREAHTEHGNNGGTTVAPENCGGRKCADNNDRGKHRGEKNGLRDARTEKTALLDHSDGSTGPPAAPAGAESGAIAATVSPAQPVVAATADKPGEPAAVIPDSIAPAEPTGVAADVGDAELMGELLGRYRRLQEANCRIATNTKVAVVRELLEVLDQLECADAEMQEDSVASRVLFSAARKFEAKLGSLGLSRIEALGKPFDQTLHRVAGNAPEAGCTSQVIVEELESGWVLGAEVVRPALVALG